MLFNKPIAEILYLFRPKPDVTAYEVAYVLSMLPLDCQKFVFEQLPPEMQRHWLTNDPGAALKGRVG